MILTEKRRYHFMLMLSVFSAALLILALTRPFISFVMNDEDFLRFLKMNIPGAHGFSAGDIKDLLTTFSGGSPEDIAKNLSIDLPSNTQRSTTILDGVRQLFERGDYLPAVLIALFSIVVPILKSLILFIVLVRQNTTTLAMRTLDSVHRFAMLDVFVVAILVVILSSSTPVTVHFGSGFICFTVYWFAQAATMALYRNQKASP